MSENQTTNGNGSGATPAPVDAFTDLTALRLDQSYADTVGVKKLLTTVPVRKPHSQEFVRTHPEFRLPGAAIIELKDDRESFLVLPAVAAMMSPGDFALKDLFLTLSRQNVLLYGRCRYQKQMDADAVTPGTPQHARRPF